MRFTLASERSRRRPSSAYVRPRARTLFFSASTKRLAAGMRPKVSDNATSQAPVAARFGLSEKCNREGDFMTASSSIPLSAAELAAAVRAGETYQAARLDRVLCIDEAAGLIEVQAATRWTEIAARLRPGHQRTAMLGAAMASVG